MSFFHFGHKSPEQPLTPTAVTPEQPVADAVASEQFQVPPVAVENQPAPETAEQAPVVSDEEVRKAMGNAAGMLDEVKQAEAEGTLDAAPEAPTAEVPTVAENVAELDARANANPDEPTVTEEDIVNGLTLPEVPAPEAEPASPSDSQAIVPSAAEVPMVIDQESTPVEQPAAVASEPSHEQQN